MCMSVCRIVFIVVIIKQRRGDKAVVYCAFLIHRSLSLDIFVIPQSEELGGSLGQDLSEALGAHGGAWRHIAPDDQTLQELSESKSQGPPQPSNITGEGHEEIAVNEDLAHCKKLADALAEYY